jgi:uncharacterized protein YlxP (DUF503 family)
MCCQVSSLDSFEEGASMLVGVLTIDLFLFEGDSLKAKRKVINSIKTHLRQTFNISISEVDYHDKWQRARLGISTVSNDSRHLDETFSKIMEHLYRDSRIEVVNQEKNIY